MFTAKELNKDTETKIKIEEKLYAQQLTYCMDMIKKCHELTRKKFTIFDIPYSVPAEPSYSQIHCGKFLRDKLISLDFYAKRINPGDKLFISWDPKLVKFDNEEEKNIPMTVINYNSNNPLSELELTSTLIKNRRKR